MEIKDLLFALLRSEITGEAVAEEAAAFAAEPTRAAAVLSLAQKHDLGHIVAAALMRSAAIEKRSEAIAETDVAVADVAVADAAEAEREQKREALRKACEKLQMAAAFRYERMRFALDEIARVLSRAEIAFMPLKGAVLRALYPQPWHRSSCDIDILVHEEDLERACAALVSEAGYRVDGGKNFHDIHLYSPSEVHLELHFSILSGNEKSDALLSHVWEHSAQKENNSFHFEQTDAFFLLHHTAHMAYHFVAGGCGIKPFLDLYILDRYKGIAEDAALPLLKEAGKETFFLAARELAAVWFGGAAHTPLSQRMEAVVLAGGVYGTVTNRVTLQQSRHGGRLRYALSRIFLSRRALSRMYPVLERHVWLLPVMQVRRWLRLIFGGSLCRGMHELSVNQRLVSEDAQDAQALLASLGL